MDTYIPIKDETLYNNKHIFKKKIAIIGSGISGLSAAWLLSKNNQVTIYEKEAKLGGHANTANINYPINPTKKIPISVDTGFIVYNNTNYPNLTNFFEALKVDSIDSDMSLSISLNNGLYEYSGSGLAGLFGQKSNIININQWKLLFDIFKFKKLATNYIKNNNYENSTIEEWLILNNFSTFFINRYIVPITSAIWSCSNKNALLFPAKTFLYFFYHHGLLNIKNRPKWKTVKNGSQEYIKKIINNSNFTYELNSEIEAIRSSETSISIILKDKEVKYDHVIMACHADQSLNLLKNSKEEIVNILKNFKFSNNKIILHSSENVMPKTKSLWSSWNYFSTSETNSKNTDNPIQVSYWMNLLQGIDKKLPLFVTLNPEPETIQDRFILKEILYRHPILDRNSLKGQSQLEKIQGLNNIWYAGAWTKYGFHEDGIKSGINVAEKLGSICPWRVNGDYNKDKIHFSN